MVKSMPHSFANPLTDPKKKFLDLQGEGSLHAGMAMQGLLKLPVWSGKLYRGESLSSEDFGKLFARTADGGVEVKRRPRPSPETPSRA